MRSKKLKDNTRPRWKKKRLRSKKSKDNTRPSWIKKRPTSKKLKYNTRPSWKKKRPKRKKLKDNLNFKSKRINNLKSNRNHWKIRKKKKRFNLMILLRQYFKTLHNLIKSSQAQKFFMEDIDQIMKIISKITDL